MLEVLRAAVVVGWGNALLAGVASLDDAAQHIASVTRAPHVLDLPGEDAPATWPVALGRLRSAGAAAFQLAAPVAGDPLGLAGPPDVTRDAVARGCAVTVTTAGAAYALLPEGRVSVRAWELREVVPPPVPLGVGEAGRQLAEVVRDSTDELDRLDVARADARADVARAAVERLLSDHPPAPTTSARAGALLLSAARLLAAVTVATDGDGGAVSAAEASRRRGALAPLSGAARRALVAAASEAPPG